MHVFTYGSLMFDPVWSRVVEGRYASLEASLEGYQRRHVRGDAYPALISGEPADRVAGRLYLEVGAVDLERLDRFEGEQYRRCLLKVDTAEGGLPAAVYLFRTQYLRLVSDKPWEPEWFAREGIHRFLNHYRGFLSR